MPKKKQMKYREVIKILRKYGIVEQKSRGKGSHRRLIKVYPNGSHKWTVVKCHGENTVLYRNTLEAIREKFGLTDEEFYGNC